MKRVAFVLIALVIAVGVSTSQSSGGGLTWKSGDPSAIVAYQVGGGVITIASQNLLTCQKNELVAESTPFNYQYKVGSPGTGFLCMTSYAAQIAVAFRYGTATTVTVSTKSATKTVAVQTPPP